MMHRVASAARKFVVPSKQPFFPALNFLNAAAFDTHAGSQWQPGHDHHMMLGQDVWIAGKGEGWESKQPVHLFVSAVSATGFDRCP